MQGWNDGMIYPVGNTETGLHLGILASWSRSSLGHACVLRQVFTWACLRPETDLHLGMLVSWDRSSFGHACVLRQVFTWSCLRPETSLHLHTLASWNRSSLSHACILKQIFTCAWLYCAQTFGILSMWQVNLPCSNTWYAVCVTSKLPFLKYLVCFLCDKLASLAQILYILSVLQVSLHIPLCLSPF